MSAEAGRCVSQPVSWLALERYHLGELFSGEREAIARHVGGCAACAACLARIEADDALALPPLALPPLTRSRRGRRALLWAAGVGALAAAAGLLLVLRRGAVPVNVGPGPEERGGRVKGGDVAFALVRDDGHRFDDGDGVFRDGDRFKAVVTCPPSKRGWFDLVVFDAGGATFPLEAVPGVSCGNDVPLPGAFRLTGRSPESVCLVWSDDGAVDRTRVSRSDLAFASHASCKELDPDESRSP
jgi:hypothetical protein